MHNEHRMDFIVIVPFIFLSRLDSFTKLVIQESAHEFSTFTLEKEAGIVGCLPLLLTD
jgi:hypothetical protein